MYLVARKIYKVSHATLQLPGKGASESLLFVLLSQGMFRPFHARERAQLKSVVEMLWPEMQTCRRTRSAVETTSWSWRTLMSHHGTLMASMST